MIKYLDMFSGIGGFRSALDKVGGFKCVGWCEVDKYAQKAYRSLYETGGESFYEDITKIDYGSMPDFDLLVGGPCCQSFSIAGNKLAFDDDRGNLFFNYIKILEVKRPRYFIAENVPNLLGISQGECFRIILEKVSELGYSLCWRVHPKGTSVGRLMLPDSGYRSQDEGCSLSDILETDVPQKYWLSEEMMRKIARKENLCS